MRRVIFHIDMNAYFASVAQQMNPLLRGKAIGVGGKPGTRGIIAAASREAKARGVKTAMSAYEALRACPELLIVDGDMDAVRDLTNKFLAIFRRYTDEVEVFSIDEAFLDVTDWHERFGGPVELARRIKDDIRRELGECITCSVGIAENKLLAKLASDLQKPDGLVVIERSAGVYPPLDRDVGAAFSPPAKSPGGLKPAPTFIFENIAETLPVTELCGIAERTAQRLELLGVRTVAELGRADAGALVDEFGPSLGLWLHRAGNGEDSSRVISVVASPKSFGNSYTLPRDTTDRGELRRILFALAEKIARRMRREGFAGRHVGAYVRYGDFWPALPASWQGGPAGRSGAGEGVTTNSYTDDGLTVFRLAWRIVEDLRKYESHNSYFRSHSAVRAVGITVSDLSHAGQLPLFDRDRRRAALLAAADDVNDRYGERTVEPFATVGAVLKRHVSGFRLGPSLRSG